MKIIGNRSKEFPDPGKMAIIYSYFLPQPIPKDDT